MAENDKSLPKRLIDRTKEMVREILETLEELAAPPPALVPVPVRPAPRGRRR